MCPPAVENTSGKGKEEARHEGNLRPVCPRLRSILSGGNLQVCVLQADTHSLMTGIPKVPRLFSDLA